jgi:predicted nucleic acid-binding protein
VSKPVKLRLFLDSNVLLGGIVAEWGLDKALLSLCAAKIARLVLAEVVRDEIEENLLIHAQRLPAPEADKLIENYRRLIDLTSPEIVPYPGSAAVQNARKMIRHEADVPVLLSAIAGQPDWLLSHNSKHFRAAVGRRAGLRIATPIQFFRTLSALLRRSWSFL